MKRELLPESQKGLLDEFLNESETDFLEECLKRNALKNSREKKLLKELEKNL